MSEEFEERTVLLVSNGKVVAQPMRYKLQPFATTLRTCKKCKTNHAADVFVKCVKCGRPL